MKLKDKLKCFFRFHDYKLKKIDEMVAYFDRGIEVYRHKRQGYVWICKNCGQEDKF